MQPLLGYIMDIHWEGLMMDGTKSTRWLHTVGFLLPVWHSSLSVFSFLFIKETHCQNMFMII